MSMEMATIRSRMGRDADPRSRRTIRQTLRLMVRQWQLYVFLLLPVLYLILFCYIPMGGVVIAFKQFSVSKGIWGSKWVGLKYFEQFLKQPVTWQYVGNTVALSLYSLAAGFPAPILLAIALNETREGRFKKTVQMVTYAPYFISTVVLVGMVLQFLTPRVGVISNLVASVTGNNAINLLGMPKMFRSYYVWSGIWQGTGYGAIIYIAALTSIDPTFYEAAIIDGANRAQKIIHIDIPCILPTIVILLILNAGNIMSVGFEKAFLMQNPLNASVSEIVSTYVYKLGLKNSQFSLSTAVGLMNSVVNLAILSMVNWIAGRISETSLW